MKEKCKSYDYGHLKIHLASQYKLTNIKFFLLFLKAGFLGSLRLRKVKNEFTCNNKLQTFIKLYIYDPENMYYMI